MNPLMKNKKQLAIKAARGLIGSSLTTQELEKIAYEMIEDDGFIQYTSTMILKFLNAEQDCSHENSKDFEIYTDLSTLVKRKRLSKSEFVNVILQFNEKLGKRLNPNQMTMDEIIITYQEFATQGEQVAVFNYISLGKSTDPYLSKMLDKRR